MSPGSSAFLGVTSQSETGVCGLCVSWSLPPLAGRQTGFWLRRVDNRRITPGEMVFAVTLGAHVSCPGSVAVYIPPSICLTDVSCGGKGRWGVNMSPKCAWPI